MILLLYFLFLLIILVMIPLKKKRLLNCFSILILIILAGLSTFALTNNVPSFYNQDNPFNVSFDIGYIYENYLVHYYDFQQDTGQLEDIIGDIDSLAVHVSNRTAKGIYKNAYTFDGRKKELINLSPSLINDTNIRSITCWAKAFTNDLQRNAILSGNSQYGEFFIMLDADQEVRMRWQNLGGPTIGYYADNNGLGPSIELNKWYMYSMVHNFTGDTIKFYLNDTEIYSQGGKQQANISSNVLKIGSQFDNSTGWFNGTIDQCLFYNYSLSQNNITEIWDQGQGRFTKGTKSYQYIDIPIYSYLNNLSINISNINATNPNSYDYSIYVSNDLDRTENISTSVNITKVNNILKDGCNCTNCSLTEFNCRIPIVFLSNNIYNMSINLTNATYGYGIDNCSNSFDISSNQTFNITVKDEVEGFNIIANGTFYINYINDYFSGTSLNKNSFEFCKYPSWFNRTGNITAYFSNSEYYPRQLNKYNVYFDGIFNSYLLSKDYTTSFIAYYITNPTLERLENVLMKIYRNIDGIKTLIFEGKTDVDGQISLYQDQLYSYSYSLNHSLYTRDPFNLQPILTSYTIQMSEESILIYNTPYKGIRYKIFPETNLFARSDNYQNITFYLEGNNLEYYGMEIDGITDCIPSCSEKKYELSGGNISIGINTSNGKRFYVSLFFKKIGEGEITINNYPYDVVQWEETTKAITNIIEDLHNNTSPNQKAVIAAFIMLIMAGIVAAFGGDIVAILWIELLTVITLSIPNKIYSIGNQIIEVNGIGLITPFFGIFISTFIVVQILWIGSKQ